MSRLPDTKQRVNLSQSGIALGLEVGHTGGEGSLTQWVHCECVVSFEAIRPVITQQVCGEFF